MTQAAIKYANDNINHIINSILDLDSVTSEKIDDIYIIMGRLNSFNNSQKEKGEIIIDIDKFKIFAKNLLSKRIADIKEYKEYLSKTNRLH
jgi:hypothetical protein